MEIITNITEVATIVSAEVMAMVNATLKGTLPTHFIVEENEDTHRVWGIYKMEVGALELFSAQQFGLRPLTNHTSYYLNFYQLCAAYPEVKDSLVHVDTSSALVGLTNYAPFAEVFTSISTVKKCLEATPENQPEFETIQLTEEMITRSDIFALCEDKKKSFFIGPDVSDKLLKEATALFATLFFVQTVRSVIPHYAGENISMGLINKTKHFTA